MAYVYVSAPGEVHMKSAGVFFDLYGTLLVFGDMKMAWADWLTTLHHHFAQSGLDMPREELAPRCDGFFSKPAPVGRSSLTVFERRIKIQACELGLDLNNQQTCRTAHACVEAWQHYVTLDPQALPVLRALREHKKLALVSNYDHPPYLHALLAELGMARLFDAIVISGEVGVAKPDPTIFRLALHQTHLQPSDVLFVGDSQDDVAGAYNAGIEPILIQRPSRPSPDQMDYRSGTTLSGCRDEPWADSVRVITALSDLIPML